MEQFQLFINLQNAAFDPDYKIETARILRQLADKMDKETAFGNHISKVKEITRTLHDINGNPVGVAKFVS